MIITVIQVEQGGVFGLHAQVVILLLLGLGFAGLCGRAGLGLGLGGRVLALLTARLLLLLIIIALFVTFLR